MSHATGILISLAPVFIFLILLMYLDSYKLVRPFSIVQTLSVGCFMAAVCLLIEAPLLNSPGVNRLEFIRYAAPVFEEFSKCLYVAYLIRRKKIGFAVDAAVLGFAVGTGFAVFENLYYLKTGIANGPLLWIVRGFGTAILHGSLTAVFAILSKDLDDRQDNPSFLVFLPGLTAAIVFHSLFNHFILSPLVMTSLMLILLPLILVAVFERSEKATRDWLGSGLDADISLLEMITTGEIGSSRIGNYLMSLKARFPGEVIADMLCVLRIHLELAIRAKAFMIARQAGLELPVGDDVRSNFDELKYLKKSMGKTGELAIQPLLKSESRELWQFYMLATRSGSREQT